MTENSNGHSTQPKAVEGTQAKSGNRGDQPVQVEQKKQSSNGAHGRNSDASVRSYWYPDVPVTGGIASAVKKSPSMNEVRTGYWMWAGGTRPVFVMIMLSLMVFLSIEYRASRSYVRTVVELMKEQFTSQEVSEFLHAFRLLVAALVSVVFVSTVYILTRPRPIYMVDFCCYQAPERLKVSHEMFARQTKASGFFDEEATSFQERLLARSGVGHEPYFPEGIHMNPPELTMARAREEAEMVMFGCMDELFVRTGLKPSDIDILVVNCSLFNPTPSLGEMVINKYKLKHSIQFYNLSGMGCSAGVLAVELAKDLLQVHSHSNAVVISTENITQNWYLGNEKNMLISNTLFRVGGAAIFLSNKPAERFRAKYKLNTLVRVHKGAEDRAFNAVYQLEDGQKKKGVALSKDLMDVAGEALKTNMTILGPMVLPWSEQLLFLSNFVWRLVERHVLGKPKQKLTPVYLPDFKKAFTHFCIHAGGRAIIDGMEQNLKLEPHHVEPSRATLYRYGNTSSSSIWYELQFIERSGRMKKGDKVFQIALGSGFQCNSAVWQRLRS